MFSVLSGVAIIFAGIGLAPFMLEAMGTPEDVLVVFCRLEVLGAAFATILSQLFSAFLVVVCLMRIKDMHRLILKKLCLDGRVLKRIIRIGLPAGMQSVMYGMSNVIKREQKKRAVAKLIPTRFLHFRNRGWSGFIEDIFGVEQIF